MFRSLASIAGILAIAALDAPASPIAARAAAQGATHTVFVSVLEKGSNLPVVDMQVDDFQVRQNGRTMEIVSVRRATTPLRVAIIDADAGTGAYQQGVLQFMEKLVDIAEFSITSVLVQPMKLLDYSSDPAALGRALDGLGRRGVQRGAQLMEAIEDAAKTVRAPGRRAVILVLRMGGEGTSALSPTKVRDDLRSSGAILYVLSVRGIDRRGPPASRGAPTGGFAEQLQLRQSELTEGRQNLQLVLGDGSRESGGRHEEIVSVSMARSVEQVADELLNQYELVYAAPAEWRPNDKLSVSTTRKGIVVHAPNRVPAQ